jgi:signal transduction histidine kinase
VGYLPTGLRLSVHNTAPAAGTVTEIAATGGGTGLLGLRRRIELIDGTLLAEPHADGGFLVDVRLPSIVLANGTAS